MTPGELIVFPLERWTESGFFSDLSGTRLTSITHLESIFHKPKAAFTVTKWQLFSLLSEQEAGTTANEQHSVFLALAIKTVRATGLRAVQKEELSGTMVYL